MKLTAIVTPNLDHHFSGVSIADDFLPSVAGSSASAFGSSRVRMLEFNVQHGEKLMHLKVKLTLGLIIHTRLISNF